MKGLLPLATAITYAPCIYLLYQRFKQPELTGAEFFLAHIPTHIICILLVFVGIYIYRKGYNNNASK